jgi:hypothetical protein
LGCRRQRKVLSRELPSSSSPYLLSARLLVDLCSAAAVHIYVPGSYPDASLDLVAKLWLYNWGLLEIKSYDLLVGEADMGGSKLPRTRNCRACI